MIYKNKIEKGLFGWISKIKDRMYRTITPRGYHIGQAAKEFIKGDTRDMSKFTPLENEVWARYLGTKYEGPSNLEPAIYRPTKGEATYDDVVKLKDESLILSDNVLKLLLDNYKKTGKKSMLVEGNESGLGTYTLSMGEDEKGKYISYYDDWDINPTRGISAKYNIPILNLIGDIVPGTHPFSVYGRRYYKNGGLIRKMKDASGGPIYYSRTMTTGNLSRAANYVGKYVLKGLGAFGKFLNAGFTSPTYGTTGQVSYARNAEDAERLRKQSEASEQAMGKAMTWVSPLNYGAAVWNGHGLDAKKGEEEVASWSPAWQAVGRLGELYVGPKIAKGVKATPRVIVNTAAKVGVKPAKAAVVAREINKGIKQNTNKGRIEVTGNYFNSPDKWYRITETPEKYGIMELGKNVTTHDAPQTPGTINGWRSSMLKAPITKSSEGFIKRPQKIDINIRRKNGQAHGNTSQAAKGKLWGGTTSGSNLFPEGIIEGQAPSMINYGIDRTNFVMAPWELVPNGGRVGFHTGEMPMSNLGWFQRTNKGTYTYEPIIPEKRIAYHPILLLEPKTSLAFFERNPSKNSIVGTSLDYSMKDSKGMDFIKQFFALLKINGKEYTLEGLKDAANVQQGLPKHIQSYLNLNTVERAVRAMRKNGYSEREILLYVDKVNEEMNKVKVGMYSDLEYNAAGALDFGGFYNNESNFLSVNKDAHLKDSKFTPEYIMKHEGRHLIDYNTSMTDDVINTLEKAYDKDFLEIPKHEDAGSLKDYQHMDRERVTTNRDARDVLLTSKGKYLLNKHDFIIDSSKRGYSTDMIDFLNKIIKYVLPEDIVNAVENSNGYGKRYINYLKKNNKLTSTKVEQLRLAMIHVPSYLLPVAGGYTLYNLFNLSLQQLQYLKQGGKMNILEFLKNGGQVRKMQTAAGGPIKKPIKRLKDGYRYIPDEQNGGWDRISDNSMSDVFATMEFTPKKTKVGSSITRKQSAPSKTYYSTYNPDDVVKGFNALTLGGLNNLSPTQWARRIYDTGKLLNGNMTWSGYTNSWINGNNGLVSLKFSEKHPYLSTGINLVGDGIGFGKIASNLSKTPGVYYHGSPTKGLTTLEPRNGLLWITDSKSGATLYGGGITGKGSLYKINNIDLGDNILTVNGKFHSPFKVPLKDLPEDVLDYLPKDKYTYIDKIANAARLAGYSSVLFKNVLDFGGKGASINPFHSYTYKQTAVFNPINITSESVSPGILGFKQGGKMNILEFLKNGSGIHIKEKNKGKFTSYCGGKVTDECILKGKNSSNPAIRKRATFAANARKWKHLDGGIIKAGTGLSTNSFIDPMIVDYIKAIENPDRVGWDGKIWKAPGLKGYDLNLRGYGIDINTNNAARKLTAGRQGQWLTDDEANTLMLDHIQYIMNAANKHIKGFGELPIGRKAALLGILYRGDSVNKSNINITEPDDTKFFNSVHNYYISKGLKERAANSSKFFKSHKNSNNTIPNFNFNNYKDLNYPFKYIQ